MILYMLIGPTGSGKSTYRKKYLSHLACVSPDDYVAGRWTFGKANLAWKHASQMALELFTSKEPFVVDAQFVDGKTRRRWARMAKSQGYEVEAIVFDTPWNQLLKNQKKRGSRGVYGRIPFMVVRSAHRRFKELMKHGVEVESFDRMKVKKWKSKLVELKKSNGILEEKWVN
jgi:predicted kinase